MKRKGIKIYKDIKGRQLLIRTFNYSLIELDIYEKNSLECLKCMIQEEKFLYPTILLTILFYIKL